MYTVPLWVIYFIDHTEPAAGLSVLRVVVVAFFQPDAFPLFVCVIRTKKIFVLQFIR